MEISSYYVGIKLNPNKAFLADVDKALKALESKLKAFQSKGNLKLEISSFSVDDKKLRYSLGNALDLASKQLTFEVSRFSVNQSALNRALQAGGKGAPYGRSIGNGNHVQNYITNSRALSPSEWDRREAVKHADWERRRSVLDEAEARRMQERAGRQRGSSAGVVGAGGAAGIASRAYLPALALVGGGYGLGALNKRNQEVVGAQLQTEAVVQSYGGTAQQGKDTFKWLQSEGDRIGFNWLEAAPDFNTLTSNLMGAGGSIEDAKGVFKGFSEYGRVNKLSNARQNLVFNALSQVAGKDKLQAEELTKQLGNSLPGAKSIFAEAYQRKLGTRLTGSEAIIKLEGDMKKGLVRGDSLKYAAHVASERSQEGLSAAQQASQAEQNRAKNAYNEQVVIASDSGVEEGYARLFRSFTVALSESGPMVERLAKGFNELSKYASFIVMLPQSIQRAFEGRDSWVADAIGKQNVETAKALYEGMKELGTEITKILGTAVEGWKMIFTEFGDEMLSFVNGLKNFFLYTMKSINAIVSGDLTGATNASNALRGTLAGKSQEEVAALAAGSGQQVSLSGMVSGAASSWAAYTPPALAYDAVTSAYGYLGEKTGITPVVEDFNRIMDRDMNRDRGGQSVEIKMDVKIEAANIEDFNNKFQEKFKGVVETSLLQWGQKE